MNETNDLDNELARIKKEFDSFKYVEDEVTKTVFPDDVMEIIGSDHHKCRDGILNISYDDYSEMWYVYHPGYVRDNVSGEGGTFLDAWSDFQKRILHQNELIRKRGEIDELENKVNQQLPKDKSIEVSINEYNIYSVSYYEVTDKGINQLRYMRFEEKMPSEEEIMKQITEHDKEEA